jgi:GAF domain-containing protein/HAMP domain-containing protein
VILRDVRESAPLDVLLPAILAARPALIESANFDAIGIYYISPAGVVRYFPPYGIVDHIYASAADAGIAGLMERMQNPERATIWTPPYEDEGGRGQVMTAYSPVYVGDEFRGAIGVDLAIARIIAQLDDVRLGRTGYAFYIDSTGTPMPSKGGAAIEAALAGPDGPALEPIIAAMRAGEFGVATVTLDGKKVYLAHAPFGEIGGSLGFVAPVDEITEQSEAVTASIADEGNRTIILTLVVLGVLLAVALGGAAWLNRRLVLKPLAALVGATREVAAGNLSATPPVASRDEFGDLAASFNAMTGQLRESRDTLEERVEERTRELRTLLEVSNSISAALNLEDLAGRVLDQLGTIMEYSGAMILLIEGEEMVALDARGPDGDRDPYAGHRWPRPETGIVADALNERRPMRIEDAEARPEVAEAQRAVEGPAAGARSWLVVPLLSQDRAVGALSLWSAAPGRYSENDGEIALAAANAIAVAIENARLFEASQEAAATEERQRLARELHDSVSQALYGIALGTRTGSRSSTGTRLTSASRWNTSIRWPRRVWPRCVR